VRAQPSSGTFRFRATDVRDEAGLARLMRRIGRETERGAFETEEAVRVTATVRREVAR
jgi:hypothetical protein